MSIMEMDRYQALQSDKEVLHELVQILRRDKLRLMEQTAAALYANTVHETLYAALDRLHGSSGRTGALDAVEHILFNRVGVEKYALIEGEGEVASAIEGALTSIPLRLDGETVGAIAIFSLREPKVEFTATDRALFEVLSRHAAIALRRME